ncbi:TIGR04376 family protein [Synechococcus elongatus IITB4]|uniref:TIGR04376 family protein n=1 Tax=Synechococcus elongatus TaxID=32046 RepID=UPI0030D123D4
MSVFDDVSRFLEDRLEEYLRNNPHLELQALAEQLDEQANDTLRLIAQLQRQEQTLQEKILATARDVQLWHERIAKAQSKGRLDLVEPAQAREAALLRQGNQLWGQMTAVKQQIEQSQQLYRQIQTRQQEVKQRLATVQASPATWGTPPAADPNDPLEAAFHAWDIEEELDALKRNLSR